MNKLDYQQWLADVLNEFEETPEGAHALEWLQTEDYQECFADGLTPGQVYDKYVNGYFF